MFREIFSFVLFISGFLCLQAVPKSWPLHYHVGSRGSGVYITCPLEAKNISWRIPGPDPVPSSQKTRRIDNVDLHSAGRYTCRDAKNSTHSAAIYVLLQGSAKGSSLTFTCVTDSYGSCHIRCSIKHEFADLVLVRAKAYRGNALEDSTWTESHHEKSPVTFTVPISCVFCPYQEFNEAFWVLAEVMTEKEYWKVDTPISMAHVVTPGAPENVTVRGDRIIWSYASSWPRPYSFFPLLFQINYKRRDNTKGNQMLEETSYSRKNICHFQVRCRDLYSPSSPWSDWSQVINPLEGRVPGCHPASM